MDVVFTYGRFNPPHLGHKMMIEEIINRARKTKKIPVVIVSHTQGNSRNPLTIDEKLNILKRWFPAVYFLSSSKNLSLAKIARNFTPDSLMVLGENRANGFKHLSFKKVSVGRPNNTPSATNARKAATTGNNEMFRSLTGYNLTNNIRNKILKVQTKKRKRN